MSDLKLGDRTFDVFTPDPPVTITATGLTAHVVPSDRFLASIKIWGAGGGGGGVGDVKFGGDGSGCGFISMSNVAVTPGETLNITVGTGGTGGAGSGGAGDPGDGGGGAGRTFVERDVGSVLLGEGGGGGGGGGGPGHANSIDEPGGHGGSGGPSGRAGGIQVGSVATFGGIGGTLIAGGAGGGGETTGDSGSSGTGGDGADAPAPTGSNAAGGLPGGGAGGARNADIPAGGGGAAGLFGGGGGGSGSDAIPASREAGAGGGGGPNVFTGTLVGSEVGGIFIDQPTTAGGLFDVDYPDSQPGTGGLGGFAGSGSDGAPGAVVIIYNVVTSGQACNDLVIEDNAPVMVEGIDQIAQQIRNILLIFQGEWFLDLAAGTPWFTRIIGHKFNSGQINITVREAILSVVGVASIQDIVSERGSAPRSANIRVTVLTTQGAEVIVETEVP